MDDLTVLGAVPDAQDLNTGRRDLIDDDVGPECDEFPRASDQTRPSSLGHMLKPVASSDDLDSEAASSSGIPLPDIAPNSFQVVEGWDSESYGHRGGGSSASVPQDKSQRRTSS